LKVLIVGGGGREHAIAVALKKSPKVTELFAAPGNGGISEIAACFPNIKATDISGMVNLAKELKADYVFVAPDDPLTLGMVDALEAAGIKAFGPCAGAALIEGSKVFSKGFMKRHNIPTAAYETFTAPEKALEYIKNNRSYPLVIKCDGLALGKGVIIAQNYEESEEAVTSILSGEKFGDSGKEIVIEEYLNGAEVTVLAFTDGISIAVMPASVDHKRAFDEDKGLNTGGMGVIAPAPYYTEDLTKTCMDTIFLPTIRGLAKEGRAFKGCLYFGLMLTQAGVKVIEYNCRFGDPETQAVLPLLKTDLFEIMTAVIEERLSCIDIEWNAEKSACIVMASGGYPEKYQTGFEIKGLENIRDAEVYHAGTKKDEQGNFVTAGGRVLGVTALGETLEEALDNAYREVEKISFERAFYRQDIGKKALTIALQQHI